jgi:phthiocerol/phenolphthiocerol synthesis type-I polyketide synthase E
VVMMTNEPEESSGYTGMEVAVIGMAGRFPGAANVGELWRNLRGGVESISFFSVEELEASGVDPRSLRDSSYVRAGGFLENVDMFAAPFFDILPSEAAIIDPQHRLFLECTWEALENAGYDPERSNGLIGVYAGAGRNLYQLNLYLSRGLQMLEEGFLATLANEKDHLTTRMSYELNLKGPSITIQTFCSTSLVATHLACQGLLSGACDLAVAGGVSVQAVQKRGYFYREEGISSPDGHCRAFDARAQGTVGGSGVGAVVLKRLAEALRDGDSIHAVIKGSAVNNDGSLKVGYTAPSVDGQARVILDALLLAEVDPATISYVEAHGTGTELGDPIEVAALTQAFGPGLPPSSCAIGSVKTNTGHLDTAAGVTGLIKTVLMLKHKEIVPSLHFEQPNPKIEFTKSPFYVAADLHKWESEGKSRRAGVSSFGIGGTNAHVILEEAPPVTASPSRFRHRLFLLSAKTEAELDATGANLADHFRANPDIDLADAAYTLQVGRRAFDHRLVFTSKDRADTIAALAVRDSGNNDSGNKKTMRAKVTNVAGTLFLFPGQGAQYPGMGRELYESLLPFRRLVDLCSRILESELNLDLREVLYPPEAGANGQSRPDGDPILDPILNDTYLAQPALFVTEYALGRTLIDLGVKPEAMIGHSVGEYVAACLAGVFSLEDALRLIAARGRLMQAVPAGAMLAVWLSESEIVPLLPGDISLAAINAPARTVVSGPVASISNLEAQLSGKGISAKRLKTSHAFHSDMMLPILEAFSGEMKQVRLNPPSIPYISNVSGRWISGSEATDPQYWVRHIAQPVRFYDGLAELSKLPDRIALEVGPGATLTAFLRQAVQGTAGLAQACSTLASAERSESDEETFLRALGRLWLAGANLDWSMIYTDEARHRVPLPTYPFKRERYWIDPPKSKPKSAEVVGPSPEPNSSQSPATNFLPERGPAGKRLDHSFNPVAGPAANGSQSDSAKRTLERVISQQLDLISEQLDVLDEALVGE